LHDFVCFVIDISSQPPRQQRTKENNDAAGETQATNQSVLLINGCPHLLVATLKQSLNNFLNPQFETFMWFFKATNLLPYIGSIISQ